MLPAYKEIREQIVKGNVKMFRCELIHVLYKKYILLVKNMVKMLVKKLEELPEEQYREVEKYGKIIEEIIDLKRDFCTDEFPLYRKELLYLEQLLKSLLNTSAESAKYAVEKDARFKEIVSDSTAR